MSDDSLIQDNILLSQNEMDAILSDVRSESKKQIASEENSLDLSQAELDALFAAPRDPVMQTPPKIERPKTISIVVGRAKWSKDDTQKFKDGTAMMLDVLASDPVEILADGHCIAKGIIEEQDGHKVVKFLSECE